MSSPACERTLAMLPLFVGGDLDAATAEPVRQHLLACLRCRGEASSLQRATLSMRRLAAEPAADVDDGMFAAMNRAIMDQVLVTDVAELTAATSTMSGRRWLESVAAVLLLAFGFWCGQASWQSSVLQRAPMATPANDGPANDGPAIVVPYAGPRVPQRLLGDDVQDGYPLQPGDAAGLMGRERLRSLVDEGMVLPARRRATSQPPR